MKPPNFVEVFDTDFCETFAARAGQQAGMVVFCCHPSPFTGSLEAGHLDIHRRFELPLDIHSDSCKSRFMY